MLLVALVIGLAYCWFRVQRAQADVERSRKSAKEILEVMDRYDAEHGVASALGTAVGGGEVFSGSMPPAARAHQEVRAQIAGPSDTDSKRQPLTPTSSPQAPMEYELTSVAFERAATGSALVDANDFIAPVVYWSTSGRPGTLPSDSGDYVP